MTPGANAVIGGYRDGTDRSCAPMMVAPAFAGRPKQELRDRAHHGAENTADLIAALRMQEEIGLPWAAVPGDHDVGDDVHSAPKGLSLDSDIREAVVLIRFIAGAARTLLARRLALFRISARWCGGRGARTDPSRKIASTSIAPCRMRSTSMISPSSA
jgi:hypothetical protein